MHLVSLDFVVIVLSCFSWRLVLAGLLSGRVDCCFGEVGWMVRTCF